ncbi:MAG: HigA family addiction module antidote protein, partial [Deltaproteobacteria bacterium]|nr:HigA family addiction module antidote protein [Deltaproteobacteria bacterium]
MSRKVPIEVFPPGEFIRDELEARGWTQEVLAAVLGRSPRLVSEIITGKRAITPETAQALGDAFDTGPQVWMNLESTYRLSQVRERDDAVVRRSRLYSKAPVKEMIRRHWIEPSDSIDVLEQRLLEFFGLKSLDEDLRPFPSAARKSTTYGDTTPAQCAWLIRVRKLAPAAPAASFAEARFRQGLQQLRSLLHSCEEVRHVPRVLADAGIRLVVVEHLSQTRIDGAAFWINAKSPVVALSLRYDRVDCFWHTLIHELMHILNRDVVHGGQALLDSDLVGERATAIQDRPASEQEADRAAAAFLVPKAELDGFIARVRPLYSKKKIVGFASRIGV